MNKYILIGALLLGMAGIVGAFFYGEHVQKQSMQLATAKADAAEFQGRVDQAMSVADRFQTIAEGLAAKTSQTQATVQTRTVYVDRVIHDKPLPADCTLDPELVRLRCESRAALYRAAGQPVPGQCPVEAAPAHAGSGEQPGG